MIRWYLSVYTHVFAVFVYRIVYVALICFNDNQIMMFHDQKCNLDAMLKWMINNDQRHFACWGRPISQTASIHMPVIQPLDVASTSQHNNIWCGDGGDGSMPMRFVETQKCKYGKPRKTNEDHHLSWGTISLQDLIPRVTRALQDCWMLNNWKQWWFCAWLRTIESVPMW